MAEPDSKPRALQASATVKADISASAKEGHAVLTGQTLAAAAIMVAGCIVGALGAHWIGGTAMAIGLVCFLVVAYQWTLTRPKLPLQFRPPPGSLIIKKNEVTVAGDRRMLQSAQTRKLIVDVLDRLASQQPLPPAVGLVKGNPADPAALLVPSPEELAEQAQALKDKLENDQRELARVLLHLRETQLVIVAPAAPAEPEKK